MRLFARYISRNMAGMIGISLYVLADTFFIARAAGADGITVLNLALPLYGLLFAVGSMIGVGSATRYAIRRAQGLWDNGQYFTQSLVWQILLGLPMVLWGLVAPRGWLVLMGGDAHIVELGTNYVRIVMLGAPFFMMNYTFTAYARNDEAPNIAMAAALIASGFNIVFDYLFMFPLGMGIVGAALATALAPVVSCLVCCLHFCGKTSTIRLRRIHLSLGWLMSSSQLGISAFVGEMSSAVTTTIFNFLLLDMVGNVGVAAYGIVANVSLVAMALFNGLAQGIQPLLSDAYGKGDSHDVLRCVRCGVLVGVVLQLALVAVIWWYAEPLTVLFNSEGNAELQRIAPTAIRLYFLGYAVAGLNTVIITCFSATDQPGKAAVASLLRGVVGIILCAVLMANIWGLSGVWLSFFATEMLTFAAVLAMIWPKNRKKG